MAPLMGEAYEVLIAITDSLEWVPSSQSVANSTSTTRTLPPRMTVTLPSAPASLNVHPYPLPIPIQLRDTPAYSAHLVR